MPAYTPLHRLFAAQVDNVDLSEPIDETTFSSIEAAFRQHSVLVFPNQPLDDEQQIAFSRRFGELEKTKLGTIGSGTHIVVLRNFDEFGDLVEANHRQNLTNQANQLWHADSSFKPVPALASMLSAREVPSEGGDTQFISMRKVYSELPDELKARVHGRYAVHSYAHSRDQIDRDLMTVPERETLPPVRQAMVLDHGEELGHSLYVGSHACTVEGLSEAEGHQLIEELMAFATQPRFIFTHCWENHDVVLWDNRAVVHRGRPYRHTRERRHMVRTTIAGHHPTVAAP